MHGRLYAGIYGGCGHVDGHCDRHTYVHISVAIQELGLEGHGRGDASIPAGGRHPLLPGLHPLCSAAACRCCWHSNAAVLGHVWGTAAGMLLTCHLHSCF